MSSNYSILFLNLVSNLVIVSPVATNDPTIKIIEHYKTYASIISIKEHAKELNKKCFL